MDYTYMGFTFHFGLDGSGNVVEIDNPQVGPLQPSETSFNPSIPVATAEAYVRGIVDALTGG